MGAKYGVSQIINNKLNIITSLAEFANISRVELTEESEKVSMVKIYLQDLKVSSAFVMPSMWLCRGQRTRRVSFTPSVLFKI